MTCRLFLCQKTNTMKEMYADPEDGDELQTCETCGGSGEVGPYGWEYPEYDTCPDCGGSGVEDDGSYGDFAYDQIKDSRLT